ncbi:MAG: inositol monophosphatase [Acidobacteriota bacterium]|nr:inositol monophosphatase [Acidobacteriota bacterium]
MTPDPLLLSTAIEAVLEAGRIQLAHLRTGIRVDKKGLIDIVTDADVAVETMFRALIAERFPSHAVVAEEMGHGGAHGSTHEWVFDPIDGTTNFAHGIPFFCSSLALEIDGVATVAAIYEPSRRELYTAERGVGAWLNGEPLRVSTTDALIDSVVCTGFPYSVIEERAEPVALFGRFLGVSRAVRRFGSAALDLAYVAAGRLDGFYETRLNRWDIAAGALIVSEAGGRVTSYDGGTFDSKSGQVLASNGRLHGAMLDVIRG